ncbi:PPOX class F420-dependent oxidoreductase [Actinokineospora fastidiosa]|uniref:PPOX class F420-dependent enzyme n=1 Tax=Actinokineospora fastidiosa TaxID=1816 RepID=A0A918LJC4_9PSEU|nr:PPOX class F420-dependent oxidoreductase [Actinokineospora fastidiosa]GGS56401.1 PPOX class F420-dependent enzyme [Actinokineospora fastidiosa]
MTDDTALDLLRTRRIGALVTLKKDGRPQLSNVIHHYDAESATLRVSVTADRAKTANLRRDPRASYYVSSEDGWRFLVVEGTAEFSAVAASPDDAAVDELVQLYRDISGEHPDWDEYRAAMVAEKRLVLRLRIDRHYGTSVR